MIVKEFIDLTAPRFGRGLSLSLLLMFAGCATAPTGPYWEDAKWTQALADAIHVKVTYPNNFSAEVLPTGEATVGFDYQENRLTNVVITRSTGHKVLDDAVVLGIQKVTPPSVGRDYSSTAHHFELSILMQPDIDQFRMTLYDAITSNLKFPKGLYPSTAVLVDIKANYLNGSLTNISMQRSSNFEDVDNAIIAKLGSASLPAPPSNFKDKPIEIDMSFCMALEYRFCTRNVGNQWLGFSGLSFVITPP
ncbi:MAG TPA: TonB C-terminal domain-containing protein [Gammaproteobacteria bacterium]|nr:TonB C-terminal domain-containing protein [Gammaproteobacteria bacterium]